jgi:hypothetical protein
MNVRDSPVMRRYEDSGLQFADAALAHLAERENTFRFNRRTSRTRGKLFYRLIE